MHLGSSILVLVLVLGCASQHGTPYELDITIMPNGATIRVDGVEGELSLSYQYPSYMKAVASIDVHVEATFQGMSNSIRITPGYCEETATQMSIELGEIRREALGYSVLNDLTFYVTSAQCDGTKDGFIVSH